jgi:Tol biopolymer transport system component
MVTGTRPFTGDTAASVIGSILKDQPPPPSTRQPLAPPALDRIVNACLAKDPDERWESAIDLARELQWIGTGESARARESATRTPWWRIAALAVAAALLGGAVMWLSQRSGGSSPARDQRSVTFTVDPPSGMSLGGPVASVSAPQLALSRDGRFLTFIVSDANGESHLWLRLLDSPRARHLAGTEGASDPFWSQDSQRIAFFAKGFLKWIGVADQAPPQTVGKAPIDTRGGTWMQDGSFVLYSGRARTFSHLDEHGGVLPDTEVPGFDGTLRWPQVLPNGKILFLTRHAATDRRGIYIGSRDGTGPLTVKRLIGSDWAGAYSSGHVLFLDGPTLMAQPLDIEAGTTRGAAIPIAHDVGGSSAGAVAFSASNSGVLAFASGLSNHSEIRWADRTGQTGGVVLPRGVYQDFGLSSDQSRLAYSLIDSETLAPDIWVLDIERGTSARITSRRLVDSSPVWSPDGERIVFRSNWSTSAGTALYETIAAPAAPVRQFLDQMPDTTNAFPTQWLQDDNILLYQAHFSDGYDIWSVNVGTGQARPIVKTPYNELHPSVSPDGRWLAYASNQSGRYEIYVQDAAQASQQTVVSTAGGLQPRWRRDGRELYYLQLDGTLMSIGIGAESRLRATSPRPLFKTARFGFNLYGNDYWPSADGQRFLVRVPVDAPSPSITVVTNWPALLRGESKAGR